MKTLLIIYMFTVLLFNMTTSYAAPPAHKEMQKSPGENCKRPPEPPKDKNGPHCPLKIIIIAMYLKANHLMMTNIYAHHHKVIKNHNTVSLFYQNR